MAIYTLMMTDDIYDLAADLAVENKEIRIKGRTIGFINVNKKNYKAISVHIQDSVFTSALFLKETDLKKGILFEGCTFQDYILLENITSSSLGKNFGRERINIHFKNCTFEGNFTIKKCKTSYGIAFDHCQFNALATFGEVNIDKGGLLIASCNFEDILEITHCTFEKDTQIIESKLSGAILVRFCKMNSFELNKKNIFSGGCQIYHCAFKAHIMLQDSVFLGMVNLVNSETASQGLYLFSSQFEKGIYVEYRKLKGECANFITEYHIQGCRFASGIFIMGSPGNHAERSIFERISLHLSVNLSGNIVFNDLDVDTIDIQGYNSGANISFNNLAVGELLIRDTINLGGLIFSGLRATHRTRPDKEDSFLLRSNSLEISNSNLGKALFFQTDFGSFDLIRMHNVLLTEISTSNVSWFRPEKLESEEINEIKMQLRKAKRGSNADEIAFARLALHGKLGAIREIYRQLKFAAQKQGDIPLSLEFQRHEMHYYKQAVANKRPIQWSEYLILLSSVSNNFGQS